MVQSYKQKDKNNDRHEECDDALLSPHPVMLGCADNWSWNKNDKSPEVRLYGQDLTIVHFHPTWSSGTAGVRGARALDARRYYWELHVSQRVFGTSMMFGVATKKARVHADVFTNLLGENEYGWGLSHKGLLWHDGRWSKYTAPFQENESTTLGLLYDGVAGTLTYYKDGKCLGVAFRDMNRSKSTLYPFVSSTAAKTKVSLGRRYRDFVNLQDRCRDVIVRHIRSRSINDYAKVPRCIQEYICQAIPPGESQRLFQPARFNTMLDY